MGGGSSNSVRHKKVHVYSVAATVIKHGIYVSEQAERR